MKKYPVEIENLSIVLIGSFNPPILQPSWLREKSLINQTEADSASKDNIIISEPLTDFQGEWLKLTVTKNRFAAATADPSCHHFLGDFVRGLFELLEHTPTTRMGINRSTHLKLRDEAQLLEFVSTLAPKSPWESIVEKPNLKSIVMQCARTDGLNGLINAKIEPSIQVQNGIFMDINSDLLAQEKTGTEYFVEVLKKHYDRILNDAERIMHSLISITEEG